MQFLVLGPLEVVVELSLRACEAASAVYAWDEAVAHLRAAWEALERTGGSLAERARLAERLGVLVQQAGTDLEEGIGHLERPPAPIRASACS